MLHWLLQACAVVFCVDFNFTDNQIYKTRQYSAKESQACKMIQVCSVLKLCTEFLRYQGNLFLVYNEIPRNRWGEYGFFCCALLVACIGPVKVSHVGTSLVATQMCRMLEFIWGKELMQSSSNPHVLTWPCVWIQAIREVGKWLRWLETAPEEGGEEED